MKYALVDGQPRGAQPGLLGQCPVCDASMTPKCGRFRAAHWAHPPGNDVDHRWERETEWHRNWKAYFPVEWHEVIHQASNGKRHIADVKIGDRLVIEFQNSPISEEERRSREEFYRPLYWVINGQRLERDRRKFFEALRCGKLISVNPLTLFVPADNCVLLQKWADSRVRVFFDFGEIEDTSDVFRFGAPVLWASYPRSPKGRALLTPVYRKNFLEAVTKGEPINGVDCSKAFERARKLLVLPGIPRRPYHSRHRFPTFEQYAARKRRARPWRRTSVRRR